MMRYPIAIERGTETAAYGVVVPDLPGCFSAGDTLDEAIPVPTDMDALVADHAYAGWILAAVMVDPALWTTRRSGSISPCRAAYCCAWMRGRPARAGRVISLI